MSCKYVHNKKIFLGIINIDHGYLLKCVQCKETFRWKLKEGFYDFHIKHISLNDKLPEKVNESRD